MVSLTRFLFFIFLAVLTACGKNEFNLDFELSSDVTDNYDVTYYATDARNGGLTIRATASLREGKCELKGATRKPTLVFLNKRNSFRPLVIYAKKGDKIIVSGNGKDPLEWMVEGNEINQTLSEWRIDNKELIASENNDSVNKAVENFVEAHPDNPASTLMILCYYDRLGNENGYQKLMFSLKGKAREQQWLALASRSDQLVTEEYSYPASFVSMIMKSNKKGSDTLMINHKNPVFMMFWQLGYTDKKALIDSIKVLEKEFPDSARLMADLCLDIDSTGWRNAIRRDSLSEKTKRFWIPNGLNNPNIVKLRVKGLPYFIVFEKNGNQSYRGTDLGEAMQRYRDLFNAKDSVETKEVKEKKDSLINKN